MRTGAHTGTHHRRIPQRQHRAARHLGWRSTHRSDQHPWDFSPQPRCRPSDGAAYRSVAFVEQADHVLNITYSCLEHQQTQAYNSVKKTPMPNSVQLRDVTETDLPIFYEQQRDPEATEMASFPARSRDAFMAHWTRIVADASVQIKTILFNGEVAGNIVCFEQLGEREVGYWLGKDYWGKGIATRALEEFLKEIKTRPLYAHVAKHNIGSKRVLEKCGFTIAGEDQFFSEVFGKNIDEYILMLDARKPMRGFDQ